MAGTLYLVATPIGNLSDLSPRAREVLSTVDFIAAEDTRVTQKLLNACELPKKPMISYYEHNRRARGEAVLEKLLAGETCALVTDAGTPAVSDPGEDLVYGGEGNDVLMGMGGDDHLSGGAGNDVLFGERNFLVLDPDGYLLRLAEDLGTKALGE